MHKILERSKGSASIEINNNNIKLYLRVDAAKF